MKLLELARCRVDTRAAADAIATSARAVGGLDVEVRGAGALGWIVIVEGMGPRQKGSRT